MTSATRSPLDSERRRFVALRATRRHLAWLLGGWVVAMIAACSIVHEVFALTLDRERPVAILASVWAGGARVERAVVGAEGERTPELDAAVAAHPGATVVYERIVGAGRVLVRPEVAFALSFVAGHDGIAVTFQGRTEYLTPDDLLSRQAYDKETTVPVVDLSMGIDVPVAMAALSDRFGVSVRDLMEGARFRRIRVVRWRSPSEPPPVAADTMTDADVRAAIVDAAHFLARGVGADGNYRYLVDAITNRTLPGYDWPRHAGATYFLAQAAAMTREDGLLQATLRAAARLRDGSTLDCGEHKCIGSGDTVNLGSTALAVIAFVEIARTHIDPSYGPRVAELAAFLRSQQRPDGEFMHLYDRNAQRPIDVQLLYFTGEAALALSRAYGLLGDPRDLDAASRALAHLVGPGWSFFGSRYYFGEEHWTCQAMDDLWTSAPNAQALDFCARWGAYNRATQYRDGDTPFDADGGYGFGPLVPPRLTPAGSRTEAAVATLDAAQRAGWPKEERDALDDQIRHSLALLVRQQFHPGPSHLFADPRAVEGAVPGSEIDWQLRIDFPQHMGSALVRWLSVPHAPAAKAKSK